MSVNLYNFMKKQLRSTIKSRLAIEEDPMNLSNEQIRNSPILIVDDKEMNLMVLEHILLPEGYQLEKASSGKEALKKALNNKYALFIIDVQMPGMDGFELAESLRETHWTKNTPIIFTAGIRKDIKFIKPGFEQGAVDYIFKPVNSELLKLKVGAFMQLYNQELELEKANNKIRSINQDLESLIGEQMIELKRKNQDLQQFAYLAAHDLKEPIGNISSLLSMIMEEDGIKKDSKELFEKTFRAVEQLRKKVGNLNEVIAVKDKFNLDPEELSFNSILEEVESIMEVDFKEKNTKINADFKGCDTIRFPKIHLVSILQNLISNSIKYSQNGKTPVIEISTSKCKGFVCLTVKDNGRGMDLDVYGNKLFKLFQRFHLDEHGKGIGLHLVNEIVENYGGYIEVNSEVNIGTTFKIYLKSLENNQIKRIAKLI